MLFEAVFAAIDARADSIVEKANVECDKVKEKLILSERKMMRVILFAASLVFVLGFVCLIVAYIQTTKLNDSLKMAKTNLAEISSHSTCRIILPWSSANIYLCDPTIQKTEHGIEITDSTGVKINTKEFVLYKVSSNEYLDNYGK